MSINRWLLSFSLTIALTGCAVGVRVNDLQPRPAVTVSPQQAGVSPGDGYLRFAARASIPNDSAVVECQNLGARWFNRDRASAVLVGIQNAPLVPIVTFGVNDAAGTCDLLSSRSPPIGPMLRIPSGNEPIEIVWRAINEQRDKVNVGQIVQDLVAAAAVGGAVVGAGPTSGLVVLVTSLERLQTRVPAETQAALSRTQTNSRNAIVDLGAIRGGNSYVGSFTTTDAAPIGSVTIGVHYEPTLFQSLLDPDRGSIQVRFRDAFPQRFLDNPNLATGENVFFGEWVRARLPSLDNELASLANIPQRDTSALARQSVERVCTTISSLRTAHSFTERDRLITVWMYLSKIPAIWDNLELLSEEGSCLPGSSRSNLREMGLNPPGQARRLSLT
jgi:hypothetical protein